jgi:hypothetical protein
MIGQVIARQCSISPSCRVRAVETYRISVVAVDVDWCCSSWGSDPCRIGIIVDVGYDNTSITKLLFHVSEVIVIRKGSNAGCRRIFIFRLEENDRSTVRDLTFCDNLTDAFSVANSDGQWRLNFGYIRASYFSVAFR